MNEFRWEENRKEKENNLISRLKTIYKEIGKQIKQACEKQQKEKSFRTC